MIQVEDYNWNGSVQIPVLYDLLYFKNFFIVAWITISSLVMQLKITERLEV